MRHRIYKSRKLGRKIVIPRGYVYERIGDIEHIAPAYLAKQNREVQLRMMKLRMIISEETRINEMRELLRENIRAIGRMPI